MAIDRHEYPPKMNDAGTTSGMFDSLRRLLSTLVGVAHTRLQLFTTELQEEVQRAAHLLLWAFVGLFAAMMALFVTALTVIFVFWDTHRIAAALAVIAVFVAIAVAAVLVLQAKLKSKPPMLGNTLAELAKDRDRLRHES
jgi:uncharacterized membrane protein YqjE